VKRRDFITLLGGAATWPLAAHAQQAMPVVGVLSSRAANDSGAIMAAFRSGLTDNGYVEGVNVAIEYRWAEGDYKRLPALAADLVSRHVSVLAVPGGMGGALAAKAATKTIPIVFANGEDPVKLGLVSSLNRPEGNITGVSFLSDVLMEKQIELLHELVPQVPVIGFLINPTNPNVESKIKDVQAAAAALGAHLVVLKASTDSDIASVFESLSQQKIAALCVASDPFFDSRTEQFVALVARHALPSIFSRREFSAVGGLMSYGTRFSEAYRQTGVYAALILKGKRPSDLPVIQSIKVELVLNLKTAKTLGLTFPITLLGRADEVIE
jgi:ABC-type uncharacterized transport system substrate-binding protein